MLGEPIPAPKTPGRKKRSCDSCSSTKSACDLRSPCGTCLAKPQLCTYGTASVSDEDPAGSDIHFDASPFAFDLGGVDGLNFLTDGASVEYVIPQSLTLHSRSQDVSAISTTNPRKDASLDWLLNFTTCSGLERAFNFITSMEKEETQSSYLSNSLSNYKSACQPESQRSAPSAKSIEFSRMMEWISHPLFPQAKMIWDAVQQYDECRSGDREAPRNQLSTKDAGVEFFNPVNLDRFLLYYWSRWAFNCPIIHKPSLELGNIRVELLLAMVLTGALTSPDLQDRQGARSWLDVVEEIIFRHPFLSGHMEPSVDNDSVTLSREKLTMLQSALFISVMQNWEGTESAQNRTRQHRFSSVVFVSRIRQGGNAGNS